MLPLLLASPSLADDAVSALREAGCLACHATDGTASVGPPLDGLVGRREVVLRAGERVEVVVDEAHVRRALLDPNAEGVEGYPAGVMPPVAADRVDALVAAITTLPTGEPAPRGSLGALAFASAAFVGGHLACSSTRVRGALLARLGFNGFMGVYALIVGAAFGGMIWAWTSAPFVPLWTPAPWTRWVPNVVMPFVFVGMMAGYLTPSPTISGASALLEKDLEPRGIQRITRHPVNLTTSLWGVAHLFPNGDVAGVLFFGGIALLGVVGSLHIDARLRATFPEAFGRYAARTSVVPFAAILSGRTSFSFSEIGWWRVAVGLATYAAALFAHQWVIGASPFPG